MSKNISPHVFIYKFPIAAISSIFNRITGLVLTSGILIGPPLYALNLRNKNQKLCEFPPIPPINPFIKNLLLFVGSFSITYHTMGGIRHFAYDKYPSLINNNFSKKSSFFIFGIASVGTISFVKGIYDYSDK
tara:strand:+ start:19 stop:414 length:396 start_codon:yes stop_codon:yes gene_type:complete